MSRERLRYKEPTPLSKAEALRVLEAGKPEEIGSALVSISFFEEDFEFVFKNVLRCAKSHNETIRGTAILCLGHLARIHGKLPAVPVIEVVRAALVDPSGYVRGQAENAADDIELFVQDVGRKIRS